MSDSSNSNGSGKYRALIPQLPEDERKAIAKRQRQDTEDALRSLRGVNEDDWDVATRPGVVVHVHHGSSPDLMDEEDDAMPPRRRVRKRARPSMALAADLDSEPEQPKPEKPKFFVTILREFRLMIDDLPPAWQGFIVLMLVALTAYFLYLTSRIGNFLN